MRIERSLFELFRDRLVGMWIRTCEPRQRGGNKWTPDRPRMEPESIPDGPRADPISTPDPRSTPGPTSPDRPRLSAPRPGPAVS